MRSAVQRGANGERHACIQRRDQIITIHSFIHAIYFYSASSSPLLLRGTPDYSIDTVSELTRRSATCNCELPKVPTRWLELESNLFRLGSEGIPPNTEPPHPTLSTHT